MDALRAEINSKRKALQDDTLRPTKYMRKGDIERMKEEAKAREQREREEAKQRESEAKALVRKEKLIPSRSATNSPHPVVTESDKSGSGTPVPESSLFNMSNEETIRRLRAKGQPIRLFGESDKDRRLRLRALELIEEKGHERQGGQNDFKKALEDVENVEKELQKRNNKGKKKDDSEQPAAGIIDLGLVKTDPDKLYPLIYYALKRTLKEWGDAMDERPGGLPDDMLARIAEIVYYMQKRQYQRANDSYLRLSIGNAPWPIGVTMVGIHERSAREKISADQVAHVLNDEVSRKYIQSLKRLLTFSQTKYPPDDVSQLMG
ncbi:hypothetical protein C0993_008308 [Termitomyces sp. T159_Od127]|nr:hypothetical protein C0993_008308 [Termitomyces sp. T159_Od127]